MKRILLCLPLISAIAEGAPKAKSNPVASTEVTQSSEIPEIKSGFERLLNEEGTGFLAPTSKPLEELSPTGESIIYKAGGRWPDPTKIRHCWTNPEAAPEIVADLQNWVSAEFRKVGIGFVWEGKCTVYNTPYQIRTFLKRTHRWSSSTSGVSGGGGLSYLGPVNASLGGTECGTSGGCTMNTQIAIDTNGYATTGMRTWTINVTRATTVHEFGHALGLAHEQERADSPVCGDQRGTLTSGSVYQFVGAYDQYSIMNYCRNGSNVSSLSEGDLVGLKTLYPNVGTGTGGGGGGGTTGGGVAGYNIRSRANNLCMDGNAWGTADGTRVIPYACGANQANQRFTTMDAGGGTFYIKNVHANKCLDIPGSSAANGARLQLYTCNQTNAQKFRLVDRGSGWMGIQNVGNNKCLDQDIAGKFIQQWDCWYEPNQQWGFYPVGGSMPIGAAGAEKK